MALRGEIEKVYPIGYNKIYELDCFIYKNTKKRHKTYPYSGLGLRIILDLEQGKETLRMDKVNQALASTVWKPY